MNGTIALQFEVMLLDPQTGARRPEAPALLSMMAPSRWIDPGLTRSAVRVTTPPCETLESLEETLVDQLQMLERGATMIGAELVLAAAHPTSPPEAPWWGLDAIDVARHSAAARWIQRRVMTSGLTIMVRPAGQQAWSPEGVGLELPMLLALSASSPLWESRHLGFASTRAAVLYGDRLGDSGFEWTQPRAEAPLWRPVSERGLSRMVTVRSGQGLDLHVADLVSTPRGLVALAAFGRLIVERPHVVGLTEGTLERNLWRAARAGHAASFEVPGEPGLVSLQRWVSRRVAEAGLVDPWADRLSALALSGAVTPRLLEAWRQGADGRGLVRLLRQDWVQSIAPSDPRVFTPPLGVRLPAEQKN